MAGLKRTGEQKGFNEEGIVLGLKPRKMFEDTTKFADVQEKSHFNAIFLVYGVKCRGEV
jgi:hypothetical protein